MKKYLIYLFVLSLIGFFQNPVFAQDEGNPTLGFVHKIILNVDYLSAVQGSDWEDAVKGTFLYNKDKIKTDKRSIAVVQFVDQSVLKVRPETEITIYAEKTETNKLIKEADIAKGSLHFDVPKAEEGEPAQQFTFTTPTGLASIRGTKGFFQVTFEETIIGVEEGVVYVEAKEGEKASGEVGVGMSAYIGADGSVQIKEITEELKKVMDAAKQDEPVKYIIETNDGRYEIKLLGDPLK